MRYVARDIMNPDVICVASDMDLRELAKLFLVAGISGAPVVDGAGHLEGVISQTDLVYYNLTRGDELVLGPFQGKPACVHIPLGQGVCGGAAQQMKTLRIENVHEYAGHIACDAASNSEIVVPLALNGQLLGVLDIDSPAHDRFSERDQRGIEKMCRSFENTVTGTGFI